MSETEPTERRPEHSYKEERDRLRLLLDLNAAVNSHLDLPELLSAVDSCLKRIFRHEYTSLLVYDPSSSVGDLPAMYRSDNPFVRMVPRTPWTFRHSPAGRALDENRPIVARNVDDLLAYKNPAVDEYVANGFRSTACAPLLAHGKAFGGLNVASKRQDTFGGGEVEFLVQVASQITPAVQNAFAFREIQSLKDKITREKVYLEDELQHEFQEIIGKSAPLRKALKDVETVAPTGSTVMIWGETGTGKELIARAIHTLSGRKKGTFVKLNCAAIPTGLLESELFGHEKGAFTGALSQRIGRFELADGGTLFLDEVGDIPAELQPKLLRVLQEHEFERLGGNRTVRVNVRVVAATHRDLPLMVSERMFRSDLYYRLNVFPITLPALRERGEDIELLVRHFTQRCARRMNKRIDSIPAETMAALQSYPWPGNVRELENFIERAVILTQGSALVAPLASLERARPAAPMKADRSFASPSAADEPTSLADVEREHILKVLKEANWIVGGQRGAAARLGMHRTTLQNRMLRLGITRPDE